MSETGVIRPNQSVLSPTTRLWLWLGGFAVILLLCWHLAVATTVATVGVGDLRISLSALKEFRPFHGLPGGRAVRRADHTATYVAFAVYAAVSLGVLMFAMIRINVWRVRRRGLRGLATRGEVRAALGEQRARSSAAQTRPLMSPREAKRAPLTSMSLALGRTVPHGEEVHLSFEDHVAVYALTGAGKSNLVMIPAALSAPGALVVTSNEVGILDLIAERRSEVGRVWVFDPLGRTHWPEPMVWNPVRGCEDPSRAIARGVAFAAGCAADGGTSTNAGFFQRNSKIALSRMLHAAALDGRTMRDVVEWAVSLDTEYRTPAGILRTSDHPDAERGWGATLESVATGADETVASSRQTLQQAVEPLTLSSILAWMTPRPGVDSFDAMAFVQSTDTLVLISDDTAATNVGPLTTMLFQEVLDSVKVVAPLLEHRKLDPPMRIVGDEFANIAPIDKAPELSAEVRKLGVQMVLAFQSDLQPIARWGEKRGRILMDNMAAELVLPGVKSETLLRRYSGLVGRVDVESHSVSHGVDGTTHGGSTSERERDVLRAEQIRELKDGTALLLWRNAKGMIVRLTPWYDTPQAPELRASAARTAARRRAHAEKLLAQRTRR